MLEVQKGYLHFHGHDLLLRWFCLPSSAEPITLSVSLWMHAISGIFVTGWFLGSVMTLIQLSCFVKRPLKSTLLQCIQRSIAASWCDDCEKTNPPITKQLTGSLWNIELLDICSAVYILSIMLNVTLNSHGSVQLFGSCLAPGHLMSTTARITITYPCPNIG